MSKALHFISSSHYWNIGVPIIFSPQHILMFLSQMLALILETQMDIIFSFRTL